MLRDDFSQLFSRSALYLTDFRPFGAYLPPPIKVSFQILILTAHYALLCSTLVQHYGVHNSGQHI